MGDGSEEEKEGEVEGVREAESSGNSSRRKSTQRRERTRSGPGLRVGEGRAQAVGMMATAHECKQPLKAA